MTLMEDCDVDGQTESFPPTETQPGPKDKGAPPAVSSTKPLWFPALVRTRPQALVVFLLLAPAACVWTAQTLARRDWPLHVPPVFTAVSVKTLSSTEHQFQKDKTSHSSEHLKPFIIRCWEVVKYLFFTH